VTGKAPIIAILGRYNLLRKHGYRQDERPDHRELDQNNPDGWNGFQALIATYMRWGVYKKHLVLLLKFSKRKY
jgi:hypothetical protein